MKIFNLSNKKRILIYDVNDYILYNDDPKRGRIYFSAYDDDVLHCVESRDYAKKFVNREAALGDQNLIENYFGLKFLIERY